MPKYIYLKCISLEYFRILKGGNTDLFLLVAGLRSHRWCVVYLFLVSPLTPKLTLDLPCAVVSMASLLSRLIPSFLVNNKAFLYLRCSLRLPGSAYRWHSVSIAGYSGAFSIPVPLHLL